MKVNPSTMLFEDLTDAEAETLLLNMKGIMMHGHLQLWDDPFFQMWREATGFDERQILMVYSTVYPQRALLSLLLRK